MAWSASGSIQLTKDWQYTDPIPTGSFFRLKHTEAPNGGLFVIAQAEVDTDGKLSIVDSQVLAVEKGISDALRLPKPECFAERRIAVKKLPYQPSLEEEVRRLFLPRILQDFQEEAIKTVSRSRWVIDIEVSDFVDPSVTVDLTPIETKLDQISAKIDNLQSSSGSSNENTTTTDQYFSNVVLLMHVDTSGAFADVKGKTVASFGNAQITTTESKFGGACAYFDGAGDYLRLENTDDFHFANSDFTIETWVKLEVMEGRDRTIIAKISPGQCAFMINISPEEKITFSIEGYSNIVSSVSLPIGTWRHVAAARNSGTVKLFIDGSLQGSASMPNSPQFSNPTYIGAFDPSNPSYAFWFRGWIDELRITKGIARYTDNFTPSSSLFPNS